MTSFTAASGPLDDVVRAHELLASAAAAMQRLETRARGAVDEEIATAARVSAANIGEAHYLLGDAIEGLQELEKLILGRTPGEENR